MKGDSFRVAYVADEPRTAMQVVERLGSLFIEENLRDREVLAEGTNQFLEAQLEDARRRLIDYERKLSDYQREHADELPSQMDFNLQAQHNAELQVQSIAATPSAPIAIAGSCWSGRLRMRRSASLRRKRRRTPRAQRRSRTRCQMTPAEQLAAARSNLASLELRFKPEHPDVVRAKRVIAELERRRSSVSSRHSGGGARRRRWRCRRRRMARENRVRQLGR